MRKINEDDYRDYTIEGPGWSYTVSTFAKVLRDWKEITAPGTTLYGNKFDGTRAIIDSK